MNTDLKEKINPIKQQTEAAKTHLLATFAHVPDDKLHWSPSPSARTPLQIVAHCGAANGAFAAVLRGEDLPLPASPEEAAVAIRNGGKNVATREAAVKLVEESTTEVLQALDSVTPERIASTTKTPFGPLPLTLWMTIPYGHMGGHVHQIDYLQTVWGDYDDHNQA